MTIASGKTWTAPGGVKIDGSLTVLTDEAATATSVAPSAYLDGATITTTVDGEAGTTTYVSDKVTQISDNQASLGAVTVSEPMRMTGSGGALMSSLTINDGMTLTYDPVVTPLRVESAPVFNGTGKLKLDARYAGVTCGKFHLVTYPSSASVSGTLNDLVDSTSFNNATYTVTEETVGDYKQLVLKVGDYDNDAKEMTIAQFGDSITEGIWRTGYRGTPNYRIPLMQLLEAYGYKPTAKGYRSVGSTDANGVPADANYKWHTGISAQRIYTGLTSGSLRAGFMESIEAHLEQVGVTDIITLKIGTNDSIGGETADNMFEGWSNLVWKVVRMRPTSKIVVCAPVKIRSGENNAPGLRTKIAEYVAKTAAEGGFPDGQVTMINGFDVVTDDANYYLTDNVHPNWNGHLQLANAWLPAVTNAFEGMTARATVNYTAQTVASAENVAELADYRAGYVKLATFSNYGTKLSTWGETPYSYVNDTYENTPMSRVAYFVARKTTASPDTRYVWVDMDADETTGTTLARFGVPTSASVNGVVNNLHIYSNSSAIENVAPTVSGVKGTLMLTEKGVSKADGISTEQAPTGPYGFDWNDTINDSGSWGVMNVARIFDGATPTNHRKLLAAQMLFDFNGFNGSRQNALGIGDFAVHGPYNYANATVDNFNLNWTFTTDKDEMPTMDARALESGVIEIWGKLDLTPTFTYDAYAGGTGPTGWFTAWGGEQFKTDRFRIGPNAGPNTNYVYYVFHDSDSDDSKAHPYVSLDSETIKTGAFSFAIYADVSQMEKNKGIIAAFGDTTKGLFLYRQGDYIKLAHVVNGGITTSAWVPGVAVQPGYHLYTVSYDTQTGAAKLYLDKAVCAATTGEGSYLHLVKNDSEKGLNAGFQIGGVYRGFAYNAVATGFNFGVGLAVCAIRGFDVPLSQSHVDVLSDEFPATNGTITWDVNPDTLSQGVSYTYLVTSATVDDANYLGVTHGKLTIPEGSTVNAKLLKVLNSDATSNNAVVDIAGTLNVTASTPDLDIGDHQADGGILLGHCKGTGTYNITGAIYATNTYLQTVNSAGAQTINIDGGLVKVKGLYALNRNNTSVSMTNGGVLEIDSIPTSDASGSYPAGAIPMTVSEGTYRLYPSTDTATVTHTNAIEFTVTESGPATINLDPNGNRTFVFYADNFSGNGNITPINSYSGGTGKVKLIGGSDFDGAVIMTDANAPYLDISEFTGRVTCRGTSSVVTNNLNGFCGTLEISDAITLDVRDADLSGAKVSISNGKAVFTATAGKEGDVVVTGTAVCNLYADNDTYLYYGNVFYGKVNSGGVVNYFHSEASPEDFTFTFEEGDALSDDENAVVRADNNLVPYYRRFVGNFESLVDDDYPGALSTFGHWLLPGGADTVPTTGNVSFQVRDGKTLTVAIDNMSNFNEVQVYGSGTVVFVVSGEGAMNVAQGIYTTSGANVRIVSGVVPGSAMMLKAASGSTATIACGTDVAPFSVAEARGWGSFAVAENAVAVFEDADINGAISVAGTLTIESGTAVSDVLSVGSHGVFNIEDGAQVMAAMGLYVYGQINVNASDGLVGYTQSGIPMTSIAGSTGTIKWIGLDSLPTDYALLNKLQLENANAARRWSGTAWFWGCTGLSDFQPQNYGNSNSVVRLTNVKGVLASGNDCDVPVELYDDPDDASSVALELTGGYSGEVTFCKIMGTGTLKTSTNYAAMNVRILDWSDFAGSLAVSRMRVVFGTDEVGTVDNGADVLPDANHPWLSIYVSSDAEVTIPSGKTWSATGGFDVAGTLDMNDMTTLSGTYAKFESGSTLVLPSDSATADGMLILPSTGSMTIDASKLSFTKTTETTLVSASSVSNYVAGCIAMADTSKRYKIFKYDTYISARIFNDEWDGDPGNWTDSVFNGFGDYEEGIDVYFTTNATTASTSIDVTLTGERTPRNVLFDPGATAYTLKGGAFNPSGTVTVRSGTVTIESAAAGTYAVDAGATLVLSNATLSASQTISGSGTLEIPAGGVVTINSSNAITIDSLTGTGTLVVGANVPAEKLQTLLKNTSWKGTLSFVGLNQSRTDAFAAGNFGNSESTISFANSRVGFFNQTDSNTGNWPKAAEFKGVLKLVKTENDGGEEQAALTILNNGFSDNKTAFGVLVGDGKLVTSDSNHGQIYTFDSGLDFTGSLTVPNNQGRRVVFGTSTPTDKGTITIDAGFSAALGNGATWSSHNGIKLSGTLVCRGTGTFSSATTISGTSARLVLTNAQSLVVANTLTFAEGSTLTVKNTTPLEKTEQRVLISGITPTEALAVNQVLTNVAIEGYDECIVATKANTADSSKIDIVACRSFDIACEDGTTTVSLPGSWVRDNVTAAHFATNFGGLNGVSSGVKTVRGVNGCHYFESYALGLTPSDASSVPTAGMTVDGDNFEIFLSNAVVPVGVVLGLSADTAAPGEKFADAANDIPTSVAGSGTNVSGSTVVIPISNTPGTQRYRLKISISGPSDPTP